jgi:hypothetical protein
LLFNFKTGTFELIYMALPRGWYRNRYDLLKLLIPLSWIPVVFNTAESKLWQSENITEITVLIS